MKKNILILLFIGIQMFLNGQTKGVSTERLPYEKVSLIIDRDLYLSGETIWFSADIQLENGQEAISNILYIELYNANQKSLTQKKFRINNGLSHGAFEIPAELISDTYFLRAYTKYGMNFPADYFFITTIEIVNPKFGLPPGRGEKKTEPSLFYFPKSPKDKLQRIGFILPQAIKGNNNRVFLMRNKKVLNEGTFLSNGWGCIDFIDEVSTEYCLAFTNSSSDTLFTKLENKTTPSFTITSNTSTNQQQLITIYKPSDQLINTEETYTLDIATNQLDVFSTTAFKFSPIRFSKFRIPQELMKTSGLYFVLLKDEQKNVVAAHSFVVQKDIKPLTLVSSKTNQFKQREKVSLAINILDTANILNSGIKVIMNGTEGSALKKLNQNISSPQLLISYLKSKFAPQNLETHELNICMHILNYWLNTEEYKKLLFPPSTKELKWIPEIRDVSLSGTLVNKNTQLSVPDIPVYLSVFKENQQIHIYDTREDGSFLFSLNNYENDQRIFLCPLVDTTDALELKINNDFSADFPKINTPEFSIDSSKSELLEQMLLASQMATIYKTNTKALDKSLGPLPYPFESPEISIVLDDYIETPTLEMIIKELVPSLRIKKKKDQYSFSIFDAERNSFYDDPLILVDNIPIFNVKELLKMKPEIIEKIETYPTPFILGSHTLNGIVMLRTFTDNFGGIIMPKSSTFIEYKTLNSNYCYKPKTYLSETDKNSRAADFRTLLHWEPLINNKQDTPIQFYTSDRLGNYEVVWFGKYTNGQTFEYRLDFQVTE